MERYTKVIKQNSSLKILHFTFVFQRLSWTRDYVFEGDIILQKDQALQLVTDKTTRKKRKITLVPAERWELPINYKFDGSHSECILNSLIHFS